MDKKNVFTIDTDLLNQFLNKDGSSLRGNTPNYYEDPDYNDNFPGYLGTNAQFYPDPEFEMHTSGPVLDDAQRNIQINRFD